MSTSVGRRVGTAVAGLGLGALAVTGFSAGVVKAVPGAPAVTITGTCEPESLLAVEGVRGCMK
ncbi:hypothetical protein [Kineosporia mesophila]|uniref:hypothetical protein n=1 Tax=Kineosporia mesophila TaxID=566012 RepID=UPI001E306908|nr:hypothetical protein [Kineosporia mesophila]MCD5354305.1 hypothetical protein [Kineosporia mesophila]